MGLPLIRFAAVFVFAAFCNNTGAFAQLTKLNVGYVGVTSDNAPGFIARETGIDTRNGLDVQLIYFNSGSTAVAAFISGDDTPISETAGPCVINATLSGSDIVVIPSGNVTLDYWLARKGTWGERSRAGI
jgi:ABC-type nitrate/sulfonate/bicarbonate transport system substrate-binding protein